MVLSARDMSALGLVLLSFLTGAQSSVLPRTLTTDPAAFAATAFDYLVVGGGTAGLTVAARLAENASWKIGVIEAGPWRPNDPLIDRPGYFNRDLGDPNYDWAYTSIPQKNAGNISLTLPRGKVLGGTSAINTMVFDRAGKKEYDGWVTLGNTPGWGWDNILPYFKKAVTYHPPPSNTTYPGLSATDVAGFTSQIPSYEGTSGYIHSSHLTEPFPMTHPYIETLNNLGLRTIPTSDFGDNIGMVDSPWAVNPTTGTRSYSAATYFASNQNKTNFVVLTGAQVTKINFSQSTTAITATGVQFVAGGKTYTVAVKKEVILSAGTYQTPQILQLSGVGNSTLLSKFGIQTIVDLPGVGENLQEKLGVGIEFELKPGVLSYDETLHNATYAAEQEARYVTAAQGIYSNPMLALGFAPLSQIASASEIAAAQAATDAYIASSSTTPLEKAQFQIQKSWMGDSTVGYVEFVMLPLHARTNPLKNNTNYAQVFAGFMHPLSRGSSRIVSADPLVKPAIDLGYLNRAADATLFAKLGKFASSIITTEPYKSFVQARTVPPPSVQSDADWASWTNVHPEPFWHPIGTSALAPRNIGGVVDPNFKVYSLANVRVVDASVIPMHIAAHPSQTIYALAEKLADVIKNGH